MAIVVDAVGSSYDADTPKVKFLSEQVRIFVLCSNSTDMHVWNGGRGGDLDGGDGPGKMESRCQGIEVPHGHRKFGLDNDVMDDRPHNV